MPMKWPNSRHIGNEKIIIYRTNIIYRINKSMDSRCRHSVLAYSSSEHIRAYLSHPCKNLSLF